MERIASFSVDHLLLEPGVYVSRIDRDPAKLLDLYIQGRQEAKRLLNDIEVFVER